TAPTITASVILQFLESPHHTGGFGLRGHDAHSRHFRIPPPGTEKSPRGIPLLRGMKWKSDAGLVFATSTDGGTSTSGITSARTDGRRGRRTTSVAWTRSPPGPISCAEWRSTTGRRSRTSRGGGAGITGGDPLDAVERTCRYIRLLKAEFGPTFHTHLYTMSTDADKIRRLADAGLDEIRFHVPPGLWSRAADSAFVGAARLARSLGLTVGIEVPLIPEREADLIRLIEWAGAEGGGRDRPARSDAIAPGAPAAHPPRPRRPPAAGGRGRGGGGREAGAGGRARGGPRTTARPPPPDSSPHQSKPSTPHLPPPA